MTKKDAKKRKGKFIILEIIIVLITIISTTALQNIVTNNKLEKNKYLATENTNSELLAKYIQKGITIGGITGTLESLDTSDATATPEDLAEGKIAYAKGAKIVGTKKESVQVEGITVPKGFYYVGGTKDNGIVISDNKTDENKYSKDKYSDQINIPADELVGNQFVWVPVENVEDFKRYPSYHNVGQIISLTNYYEPSQTGYQYETEIEDYIKMMGSIAKNKGFFVARFEAGKEGETVVSKRNATVYNIGWGNGISSPGTNGAVAKAENMYTVEEGYEITSTLIYGTQWDAIMAWIDSAYKTSNCAENSFVRDSTGKGNYSNSLALCGSSDNYRIKNIYDLAGNVWEWTLEANDTRFRVMRGGSYGRSGAESPASSRTSPSWTSLSGPTYGFRVALYL